MSDPAPIASGDTAPVHHTVSREDGTSFAVTVHPAAEAGPVILVVPAMGMPAGYYGKLATALAEAGWTAAVMEQRGHEETGGRRPGWRYDFGYAELADDIDAAVRLLAAGGEEVYLLGHSLGGQVGSTYAARNVDQHPDRVAGLILVAAPSPYWRTYGLSFLPLSQAMSLLARVVGHFPGKHVRFAGREARGVMSDWARLTRTGRIATGRPRVDHSDALARLRLPALVVSVEGDTLAPAAAVDRLAAMMPSVELERVHLEDDGIDHFRWARRPESVVPTIDAWLTARSRSAS